MSTPRITAIVALVALSSGQAHGAGASPLSLREVLGSVRRLHPKLAQARLKVTEASGGLQAARGGFDPLLSGETDWKPQGDYRNGGAQVTLRQPTALWGLAVFGQWSLSRGSFPEYDGDRVTATAGLARLGLELPLLAGGPIDKRRGKIAQAQAKQRGARFAVASLRLELLRLGARAYFAWVAAGQKLGVERELLELARRRDQQVAEAVRRGAVPAIERVDNKRAILRRRGRVIKAQRAFEKAALKLSLYLRGSDGRPMRATLKRLPKVFPSPQAERRPAASLVAQALSRRPELGSLRASRERIAVDRALAKNQRLPKLSVKASGAVDLGAEPYLDRRSEVKLGLSLQFPLLFRQARGRVVAAEAGLKRLTEARRGLRDRIEAQVRDALSALEASRRQLVLAEQELSLARRLEAAERERQRLGTSTLLLVNIRERSTAKVARKVIDQRAKAAQAEADLRAVIAAPTQG